MDKKKINSLQVLRAVAVSLVVFLHVVNYSIEHSSIKLYLGSSSNLKLWGAIGVDLFFAISGFIMTLVLPSYLSSGGLKRFIVKRIGRIVPLYYLFAAFATMLAIFKHQFAFTIFVKTFIFLPIFDKGKFIIPFVGVGWSLSYEIYFYLLIAILLGFKQRVYLVLVGAIALLSTIGLFTNFNNVLLRFLTSPLLIEFGLGIICGWIYDMLRSRNLFSSNYVRYAGIILTIVGAALMVGSLYWGFGHVYLQEVIENDNPAAFYRVIVWGGPCALFLLGMVLIEAHFSVKFPNLLVLIGDASYSCYLIHGFLYAVIYKALHNKLSFLGPDIFVLVNMAICIAISIIFYKYVEKFIVKWSEHYLARAI